jgi:hypothetical protein
MIRIKRLAMVALVIALVGHIPAAIRAQDSVEAQVVPDVLNVRESPSITAPVIAQLTRGAEVTVTGWDSTVWVFVTPLDGGFTGWVDLDFLDFPVGFDVTSLPVIDTVGMNNAASAAQSPTVPIVPVEIPASAIPVVGDQARAIFEDGQARGNRADVFAKVGDSITDMPMFLFAIGAGQQQLGDYTDLQTVIDHFMQTTNSFSRTSAAARGGWTSGDLLDPSAQHVPGVCNAGESPLACEYRLLRPAVALIMIGTNDILVGVDNDTYRAHLETIVQTSIDSGVIPVLSTIPDNQIEPDWAARVPEINTIIRSVASAYGVPLWDYWLALQGLPNKGLSSDNLHPSYDAAPGTSAIFTMDHLQYGFNVRNLTALLVLNAVWQGAMY